MKKILKKNNYIFLFFELSKTTKFFIISFFVFCIANITLSLIGVYFPKEIVSVITDNDSAFNFTSSNFTNLIIIVGFFLILNILALCSRVFCENKNSTYMTFIRLKLKEKVQYKSQTIEYEKLENADTQNKRFLCNQFFGKLDNIINSINIVVPSFILLCTYSFLLIRLNFIIIFLIAVNIFFIYKNLNHVKKFELGIRENQADIDRKKNYLFKTMFDYGFAKDIRVFNFSSIIADKFYKESERNIGILTDVENKFAAITYFEAVMTFIREGALYLILVYYFIQNRIRLDEFIMYIGMTASFMMLLKGMLENVLNLIQCNTNIKDYREYIQIESEDNSGIELQEIDSFTLRFQNVSFSYPGNDFKVLHNINFIIGNKEHVSITGLNGAGKSTIVKLICRMYKPTEGNIFLNDIDIQTISMQSYLKNITAVFQDSSLLALTLWENISLDNLDEDKKRFWEALENIGMRKVIENLEHKENTNILKTLYTDGTDFSGGERQKLLIARALYKNSPIVLLDEPVSALDALAEKELYEKYNKLYKDKTTLIISHRLNSNRFCDKIIFIENGKILMQDNHDNLLKNCPQYNELYQLQAQYYIDERTGDVNEKL